MAGLQEIIRQIQAPRQTTAMPVRTGDRIVLLKYDNIIYLEAQDKYVYIHTTEGQRHLTDQSLSALSENYPPNSTEYRSHSLSTGKK